MATFIYGHDQPQFKGLILLTILERLPLSTFTIAPDALIKQLEQIEEELPNSRLTIQRILKSPQVTPQERDELTAVAARLKFAAEFHDKVAAMLLTA